MLKRETKLNLSDIIDIKFLQEFQDIFAKTTHVASIMVDDKGPITAPSNFTDFCIKHTRRSPLGFKRCNECDIECGKIAAKTGKPAIYTCHSGLTDFAVPIIVEGEHIGSILGGQVLTEPPNEDDYRKKAKELGINEDEYIKALRKIKIIPLEQVKAAADLLFFMTKTISEISLKNLELIKKSEREQLIGEIIAKSISTFDSTRIKQIVDDVGVITNADKCYFIEFDFDRKNRKTYSINVEYLESPDTKSIIGYNVPIKTMENFDRMLVEKKDLIIFDYESMKLDKSEQFTEINKYSATFNLKSGIGVPFWYMDQLIGVLCIEYIKEKAIAHDDDLDFLRIFGNQIGMAFGQIQLFEKTKKTAEREAVYRKITETIRSSLNTDKTLNFICEEIAKLLNIQRATIVQFPDCKNYENYKIRTEYKIDADVKGLTSVEYLADAAAYWGRNLGQVGEIIAFDNIEKSDTPDYFKQCYSSLGIKSMIGLPIKKGTNQWGSLVLSEYENYRHWTDDEKDLLETISDQIYIAINQAELYETVQINAENERVLREIMLSTVSTFDIKEVISSIVTQAGELFKADRCLFVEYNVEASSTEAVKSYSEYLSSTDIPSHLTSMPDLAQNKRIINILQKRKVLYADKVETATINEKVKRMLIDDLSVKSYLIAPVYYGDIDYGSLVFHYVNKDKEFTQEDINVAQTIANQSAIIIHKVQLYSTIEKNEKYTRTIMDSIKDGIVTINDDYIIESCNPATETIWGYSASEIIGQTLGFLLHHECSKKEKKACFSGKRTYGIKKSGEEFPVEIDVSEVTLDDKNITLLVIRDVTERKKIEKMKNEFISTVSHELRTPLTSIKGSLGLIKSGVFGTFPPKVDELINIANNNCSRLTNLINDILDLEKIKAGKYEFKNEILEISSIIEQSVTLNQAYADQFGMKIKMNVCTDETYVNADKNRLLQVLSNLISNAVKFSKIGGEVIITSEIEAGNIKVSVIDNGIGIPDDSKYKIFSAFSQVDSSDTRSKGGTGLGLSISKIIIEKMGGNIGFISKVNEGSTFSFVMPTTTKQIKNGSDEDGLIGLNAEDDAW